ncbi:serine-type D-Ala-D-Ala carboxypeptidase [Vibrio mexicanus]|uniref:serine-type D-Ala-D-Ala carboxypeptidase n=1 Tax=Vibrio mexicanus TaxID=1004326 RepID=UPI000A9FD827
MHKCWLFITLCFSSVVWANYDTSALPKESRHSLVVKQLAESKENSIESNSGHFFPPASTLKIITALAATLELDNDHKFETKLLNSGNDWIIQFSGDPTLTTQDLDNIIKTLQERSKGKTIGNIWLDNSAFTGYDRAVGWPWDILGVCYSAPASAISIDGNCVQASIYTQDQGKTRVYVPEHFPIHVSTKAKAVTKEHQESTQCTIELISQPDNFYQLQGCLVEREKALPLKFAIQNPELYTTRVTHSLLNQHGVKISGNVQVGAPKLDNSVTVYTHYSAPLPELLEEMLKKSDNLIADSITKTLGAHFYLQAGSFGNGTEAIKQIIFSRTGIDLGYAQLADGSGLSRNNLLTSQSMASILEYIWKHDEELGLIDLFPRAGESGTLKYRRSMRKEPIKGQIAAKSGSVYGSYNMAGYGLNEKGEPTSLFVQFVADYHPRKKSDGPAVITPITQFETQFYQDVVRYSQEIPKK